MHCPAVTLARRRPLAQSIAPSIAPSITRRHRRPGVRRWAAVVDRPPSPDRSLARPPALARRRSLAVVRSFARRRSPAAALVICTITFFYEKLKNVSFEYDRVNG